MGITAAQLMVKIGADTADAERGLQSVSDKLSRFGEQAQRVGMGLSVGITAPLTGAGLAVWNFGVGFESAFAGVRKTVDATDEQLATLRQGIRDMAGELPATTTEIAGVAEAAGQLGIQTDNIVEFTRTMVDLGVATNLSGDQAATALARLANITQMPQTEFDRLGSTVVDLGNNLATTEAEIVEMGLRIAGAGKQVGLTEAQILGFAGALSSVGIEAQAGGTAISRVMIELANTVASGGENLERFASVAGMSAEEFAKAFREDAAKALITFIEGLGQMSAEGENVFGLLDELSLGEIRVRDALLRASGAGDLFRESIARGSAAWAENTALVKEAEQRYQTVESRFQMLMNRVSDVAVTLYDKLRPTIVDLLDKGGQLVEWVSGLAGRLSELDPTLLSAALAFGAIMAAAGPLLLLIGTLVATFGALVSPIGLAVLGIAGLTAGFILLRDYFAENETAMAALVGVLTALTTGFVLARGAAIAHAVATGAQTVATNGLAVAQRLLNVAMSANPIGIIITLLAGLTAAVIYLWETNEDFRNAVTMLWNSIRVTIQNACTAVGDFFGNMGERIGQVWEDIKANSRDAVNAIIGFINQLISAWNGLELGIPGFDVELPGGHRIGWGGVTLGTPDLPMIPTLDSGALITGPTLALLAANNRPEVVMPLDRSADLIDYERMADTLARAMARRPTYQIDAHYRYQAERDLRDDIRMLQLLGASV